MNYEMNSDCSKMHDVAIIGAGWSGLMACKYCLDANLVTVVLEASKSLGGVWDFDGESKYGGVMSTTQTTSSKCLTEMSDYPMPETYPHFPSHNQIYDYLQSYADKFNLHSNIDANCVIQRVWKVDSTWHIQNTNNDIYFARDLIVCSGVHRYPNDLSNDLRFKEFSGEVIHCANLKQVTDRYKNKSVLILGGGESASDVANEMQRVSGDMYWCIPNGQWFVNKIVNKWPPFPSARPKVVDHTSSRLRLFLSPTHLFSPFINQYLSFTYGFNGHGIEEWRTHAPYNRSFFNKSAEILSFVHSGRITPKRDVLKCNGKTIMFSDGEEHEIDILIFCSGYKTEFPFLDLPNNNSTGPKDWYKYIFDEQNIAFIGFVRPIFGSIPGIAELQARFVAKVFSGNHCLPDSKKRNDVIKYDNKYWNKHFRFTSNRISGLVDHFLYCDQLATLIGCRPNFTKLFFSNPSKWWVFMTTPWNGCQFWHNDASQHERIYNTFNRYRDNQCSEVYIFILLTPILPVLGLLSWVCSLFKHRKLKLEKSSSD